MDKKYRCIGGFCSVKGKMTYVDSHWLPRWYGVPHKECVFITSDDFYFKHTGYQKLSLILLTPRDNGDYKEHLAKQRLKHLLEKD